MWLCFNDGFISVVQNRENDDELLVRARRREILKRLFPNKKAFTDKHADYRYRLFVTRDEFKAVVAARVEEINYDNFKNSVENEELHDLYARFWGLHARYQQ